MNFVTRARPCVFRVGTPSVYCVFSLFFLFVNYFVVFFKSMKFRRYIQNSIFFRFLNEPKQKKRTEMMKNNSQTMMICICLKLCVWQPLWCVLAKTHLFVFSTQMYSVRQLPYLLLYLIWRCLSKIKAYVCLYTYGITFGFGVIFFDDERENEISRFSSSARSK